MLAGTKKFYEGPVHTSPRIDQKQFSGGATPGNNLQQNTRIYDANADSGESEKITISTLNDNYCASLQFLNGIYVRCSTSTLKTNFSSTAEPITNTVAV